MSSTKQLPDWLVALIFMPAGAAIVLLSLGVIPSTPSTSGSVMFDGPQHWQILCIGLAFFSAGAAFAIRNVRWLQPINWLVGVGSFFSVAAWVLFFSGQVPLPVQILCSIPLAAAAFGAVMGLREQLRGAPVNRASPDPIAEADVYLAYGRCAQAEALLQEAIKSDPIRATEFRAKLDLIQRKSAK